MSPEFTSGILDIFRLWMPLFAFGLELKSVLRTCDNVYVKSQGQIKS